MTCLVFFVVAPEAQIKTGVFTQKLNIDAITKVVQIRAKAFSIELGSWADKWFFPALEIIRIETLLWESFIGFIESNDLQA